VSGVEVRDPSGLKGLDGLILPGGESTTIIKLINTFEMRAPLIELGKSLPVWGSCAGMILMSREVEDGIIEPLGLLDISVARNAYGRQIHSTEERVTINWNESQIETRAAFIRAPRITRLGESVQVLAKRGADPVLIRQGNLLASSYHDELFDEGLTTEYFLKEVVAPTLIEKSKSADMPRKAILEAAAK
ncbi:MAG: pyridoxal 5'-phosphate synthase glutaminase subunit PdxT, partial [candidate division Zixibacteria bacterium]|nr:pyridoxal 5'-phosphate synthase glutaminase subunit PdxT [candidate division Zixibacteria bacterium]